VKHGAAVLKVLFSKANMPMATKQMMDEYLGQRMEGVDSVWTNWVIRMWNRIFEKGKVQLTVMRAQPGPPVPTSPPSCL